MAFLGEFDDLMSSSKKKQANRLLYNWLIYRREALFEELRRDRPILKFWSLHPGNPDLDEAGAGYAYLLSNAVDVEKALQNFTMEPYNRIPPSPFVLTIDNKPKHDQVRDSMARALALTDPASISALIQAAVEAEWWQIRHQLPVVDVRAYVRNVALRFTGAYFGIPEKYIFSQVDLPPGKFESSLSGVENLQQWSGEGYENFIWKIHARHFGSAEPQMQNALQKIGFLIQKARGENPEGEGVINRFFQEPNFPNKSDIVINLIGAIQGLVDNVMTGACYALNVMIARDTYGDLKDQPVDKLIAAVRKSHRQDTPSPFLPRRGSLRALDPSMPDKPKANFACAIGSALNDPDHDPGDIRLGSGMHQCIGLEIGDEIEARALQKILQLKHLSVMEPLQKQWGWIVNRFTVLASNADALTRKRRDAVNRFAYATPPRPRPYGLWSADAQTVCDYTTWRTLTDRSYFSRHLQPACQGYLEDLPDNKPPNQLSYGPITELFRRSGAQRGSRSSLLFAFFAQWLTDSFLRTDPADRRRTTSNHQIDMCQLYGLTESTTSILRSGVDGKLKTEPTQQAEYPPFLFDSAGHVKPEFRNLPYVLDGRYRTILNRVPDPEAKEPYYFATGLERGNSTPGYTALSTLFLREHNRICRKLQTAYPGWDDEQLFQTARMIVIVLELKIVIEEYINHISGRDIYALDPDFAERESWYRTNWIALEFDLLYRWHSLIPNEMKLGGQDQASASFLADNRPLIRCGLGALIAEVSAQQAGQISLLNTPDFLMPAEDAAVAMSRQFKVRSYNDYREQFNLPRLASFGEFEADGALKTKLAQIYGTIDNVEFLVGLYGEEPKEGNPALLGDLMTTMVAYDAFTHALTNPLLSKNIYGAETFTDVGMHIIEETSSLLDILERNDPNPGIATFNFAQV